VEVAAPQDLVDQLVAEPSAPLLVHQRGLQPRSPVHEDRAELVAVERVVLLRRHQQPLAAPARAADRAAEQGAAEARRGGAVEQLRVMDRHPPDDLAVCVLCDGPPVCLDVR
jgi:hypothetical protein